MPRLAGCKTSNSAKQQHDIGGFVQSLVCLLAPIRSSVAIHQSLLPDRTKSRLLAECWAFLTRTNGSRKLQLAQARTACQYEPRSSCGGAREDEKMRMSPLFCCLFCFAGNLATADHSHCQIWQTSSLSPCLCEPLLLHGGEGFPDPFAGPGCVSFVEANGRCPLQLSS